mgnify:CR=1 FL=1
MFAVYLGEILRFVQMTGKNYLRLTDFELRTEI